MKVIIIATKYIISMETTENKIIKACQRCGHVNSFFSYAYYSLVIHTNASSNNSVSGNNKDLMMASCFIST